MTRWIEIVMCGIVAVCLYAGAAHGATIFVDGTYTGPTSNGSELYPYKKINDGIVSAASDDTVKVKPGVYWENVVISKSLTLSGTGPDSTIIKGKAGVSVTIQPNLNVTIEKLTVTGSSQSGILLQQCSSSVSIVLQNIVCTSNTSHGCYQYSACKAVVAGLNCTFADNSGSGAVATGNSSFTNCIATSNGTYGFSGTSSVISSYVKVNYSLSYGNPSNNYQCATQANCLSSSLDPLYIDAETGDYRLRAGSPCRYNGSPDQTSRNPDGSRNDLGAYGGPDAAEFYNGYGSGPVVTDLQVSPASVPFSGTFNVKATGKAQ